MATPSSSCSARKDNPMTRTVRIPLDHARKLTDQDGENGGVSRTPRRYSNPDAGAKGTDVLAGEVLRLADQS
jgi:hypothetical protein